MPAPGAHITYQANRSLARHGWLHLTPAYAADLVSTILEETDPAARILDPFAGSGTTVIRAAQMGRMAVAWDINPFLLELMQAKSLQLDRDQAAQILTTAQQCLQKTDAALCPEPEMHNLARWWPDHIRLHLRQLKTQIQNLCDDPTSTLLLRHAFAACVKATAQVDHRHHSLSFSDTAVDCVIDDYFIEQVQQFCDDCQDPLPQTPQLMQNDARNARSQDSIHHVICSPPYPNRMSYMRELRPYMYWLDYLHAAHECADMDWLAIGGTWGTATNRLNTWQAPHQKYLVPSLQECLNNIPEQGSSAVIKQYIQRYTYDMYEHFSSLKHILAPDAHLDYIVGNAFYYGVEYPSAAIFEELLDACAYRNMSSQILRRRSSNKSLFEYRISAQAPVQGCCSHSLLT